jgi:hypothetical protein
MRGEPEAISMGVQETFSRVAREQDRTGGAAAVDETVRRLRSELAVLRATDLAGIVEHRQVHSEISRIERSLKVLQQKLSGRVLQ